MADENTNGSNNGNSSNGNSSDGSFKFSTGETVGMISGTLGNVLQSISAFQAARLNFSNVAANAREMTAVSEYNIAKQRQINERVFAENRVRIAASGIDSRSFTDVQRSNLITAENDVAAMREQVRRTIKSQMLDAVAAKKRAKKGMAGAVLGTAAGGLLGLSTGNPYIAVAGAQLGSQLGSAAGGY